MESYTNYILMMHIMNKHREVDLKLYSEINECVSYHAKEKC